MEIHDPVPEVIVALQRLIPPVSKVTDPLGNGDDISDAVGVTVTE